MNIICYPKRFIKKLQFRIQIRFPFIYLFNATAPTANANYRVGKNKYTLLHLLLNIF